MNGHLMALGKLPPLAPGHMPKKGQRLGGIADSTGLLLKLSPKPQH